MIPVLYGVLKCIIIKKTKHAQGGKRRAVTHKEWVFFRQENILALFFNNFCNSIFFTLHLFFNLQFNPLTDGFHISILNYTDVVRVDGKGPLEVLSLHNCWLGPAALELLESLFL